MRLRRPRLEARAQRLLRAFEALNRLELVPMHRLVELAWEAYQAELRRQELRLHATGQRRVDAILASRTAAADLRDQLRYHERLLRRCFRGHPGLGHLAKRPRIELDPDRRALVQ